MGTMRVADYIADFLAEKGTRHIFLLPGGGAMFLNDAVAKNKKLTGIPCHHEQTTAIAAEAYSRNSQHLGVAMVTTGPGGTNAVTGVAGAWIESVPLLVLSGQVKRADLLKDSPLRQKGVQEVDIVSIVKPITKYAVTISSSEEIRYELEKAIYLARSGRMGPVWIDVPLDVQASQIDPQTLRSYSPPAVAKSEIDINEIVKLLEESKRPLILAGHGVRLSGAADNFRDILEKLGVPAVFTWNAMDLLPGNHALNIGRPGVVALRAANFAVQNCDLLISIGSRLDNIITAFNPSGFARAAKKIVVDIDANEIDKLAMNIDVKLNTSADTFLDALSSSHDGIKSDHWQEWIVRCTDWKKRYSKENSHAPEKGQINHFQLIDTLSETIPPGTLIATGSSGLAVEVFYTLFRNKENQRIFLTSGLGAMGYGVPAAIGACLAGNKPIICLESDGSLQLNIQELATIRALNLPIKILIMNNGGYASIRNTQKNYFEERYLGTGPESNLWMPDLEKIAAAYELPFMCISDPETLKASLSEALAGPGPKLIDIRLKSNETLSPKVSAIPQADGSMISMPLEDMSPLLPREELEKEMIIPLSPASLSARNLKS